MNNETDELTRAHIAYGKLFNQNAELMDLTENLRKKTSQLVSETWYVLSGGDSPSEKCSECGCAGYGELRDKLKETEKTLAEFSRVEPVVAAME